MICSLTSFRKSMAIFSSTIFYVLLLPSESPISSFDLALSIYFSFFFSVWFRLDNFHLIVIKLTVPLFNCVCYAVKPIQLILGLRCCTLNLSLCI